jgi:hypothetical protein
MRIAKSAALAAAVCLLAAGCGSVRYGAPGTGSRPARPGSATPTATRNEDLAAAQAARLLSLAPVPAGATPLRSAPRSLASPAVGAPAVRSLVDKSRSWRVPMPFAQATAWLAAHRPRHLSQAGSSQASGPAGPTEAGYGYDGPSSPAWQSAELDVSLAPAGPHASVLRADGVVVWLDPVPLRDTATGRRARVTTRCPRTDSGIVGVTNRGADLSQRLLPAGRPTGGLECTYYGMNGHPWQLRRVTQLTAAQARRVAATMSGLPLSHTVGAVISCPLEDGSAQIIALSYPGRAAVDLWNPLNGCRFVANGFIQAGNS